MSEYFEMQAKAQQKPANILPNSKHTAQTLHDYCRSTAHNFANILNFTQYLFPTLSRIVRSYTPYSLPSASPATEAFRRLFADQPC